MYGDVKFIVDASLAGLAKWLRLLGYDTVIYPKQAGRPMMSRAQSEARILLTRRRDMMERQFSGQSILLPQTDVSGQLQFIVRKLNLNLTMENMYSRCLGCNERLHPRAKADVRDRVPEYVFQQCGQYNQCPTCGKIFWPGTHQRNALQYLKDHGIVVPDLYLT